MAEAAASGSLANGVRLEAEYVPFWRAGEGITHEATGTLRESVASVLAQDVTERNRAEDELRRVRQLTRPDRVQHDDAGARHGAILRWSWTPSSGCSAWRSGS